MLGTSTADSREVLFGASTEPVAGGVAELFTVELHGGAQGAHGGFTVAHKVLVRGQADRPLLLSLHGGHAASNV